MVKNTISYKYYIKDHLGNNRAVADHQGNVMQYTHYYPYGSMLYSSTEPGYQKFKYNGKEYDTMHGLNEYDYGARQYDPAIAQFTSMDPLCEKYYNISPYAYCGGSPVNRVDPNGMYIAWFDANGNEWIYKSKKKAFYDGSGNKCQDECLNLLTQAANELYNYGEEMQKLFDDNENGVQVVISNRNLESPVGLNTDKDGKLKSGVRWNPQNSIFQGTATISLGHELAHSYDRIKGITKIPEDITCDSKCKVVPNFEKYAVHVENKLRAYFKCPLRTFYYINNEGNGIGNRLVEKGNKSSFFNIQEQLVENNSIPYVYKVQ